MAVVNDPDNQKEIGDRKECIGRCRDPLGCVLVCLFLIVSISEY